MSGLRVQITAEQIAAAGDPHKGWDEPVTAALDAALGQPVAIDSDGDAGYIATIGDGAWVLVVDLPEPVNAFLDYRWQNGGPGAPFGFDFDVPDWIVVLVARAASVLEQGDAVMRADGVA